MSLSNETKDILREKVNKINADIDKYKKILDTINPNFEELRERRDRYVNLIQELKDIKNKIKDDLQNN